MLRSPLLRCLAACLAGVAVASAARADKVFFSGEHGITFTPNFGIASEVVAMGTGVAEVNEAGGGVPTLSTLRLTRHFAEIGTTVSVTNSLATEFPEVQLAGVRIAPELQGGSFAPILAAVGGGSLASGQRELANPGQLRFCRVAGCASAVSGSLVQSTSLGGVAGVGIDNGPVAIGSGPTLFTLNPGAWTANTAAVAYRTASGGTASLTAMGFVEGPLSNTGTTLSPLSAPMSGRVQLVAPVSIDSNVPGVDLGGFIVRLTLHFEPEPGRLLLLGAGAAGLLLLALRHRNGPPGAGRGSA